MSEQTPHLEILSRNRVNRSRISLFMVAIPVTVFTGLVAYALVPFLWLIGYGIMALATIGALYLVALLYLDIKRRALHAKVVHLGEYGAIDAEQWRMLPLALPAPHVQVSEAKDMRDLEKEIRDLAAGGRHYRDIAKDLGISFYQVQKVMSK
jgi:hypothetical protein